MLSVSVIWSIIRKKLADFLPFSTFFYRVCINQSYSLLTKSRELCAFLFASCLNVLETILHPLGYGDKQGGQTAAIMLHVARNNVATVWLATHMKNYLFNFVVCCPVLLKRGKYSFIFPPLFKGAVQFSVWLCLV